MVKLVDTRALGARAARRGGSSPLPGTSSNHGGSDLNGYYVIIPITLM